jgi:hypothetical protein
MRIDLLRSRRLIEGDESMQEVVASSIIIVTTGKVGEVFAQAGISELFSEKIDLIKEEDLEQ